jgi:hypothetical protein
MTKPIPADDFQHGDPKRFRRGCRCTDCTAGERARRRKSNYLAATGRNPIRDPQRAVKHITALRAAGMTDLQICATSGVCNDVIYRALRGGQIHTRNEQKLLAVPIPAAPIDKAVAWRAREDGTGTRRRLRALAVMGWPSTAIARRLGVTREHVNDLTNRDGGVQTRTVKRIREVYLQLWNIRPEDHGVLPYVARQTRERATAKGWHPAAVWDDIDNPAEEPKYGLQSPRQSAIVEDAEELARHGLTREAIAQRLGVSWGTVLKAHHRAGTPVPEMAA